MKPDSISSSLSVEKPFPLKRIFRRTLIPALIGYIVIFLILLGFTAQLIIESVYLEQAQRRAQTIARTISIYIPDAWDVMMQGQPIDDKGNSSLLESLTVTVGKELDELGIFEIKIYSLERQVLFATHTEEIGTRESAQALKDVIKSSTPEIVTKTLADKTRQFEFYVPVYDKNSQLKLVFELYEPVSYLNAVLLKAALPMISIPAMLLLLFVLALNQLVNRAQADIDMRNTALNELRYRIESFVSIAAVNAAKGTDAKGNIKSELITTTLFFSDIRDFTGYSEQNTPEEVVNFLNKMMTLQMRILQNHGGDVDKMIGDAILARFDDDDGSQQAIQAACEIQEALKQGDYPRKVGIGIYRGEVISGAIGPEDRRDYTVIGDSVNISARLCSAAKADEVVVDANLADNDFGDLESLMVKGRQQPVKIRRHKV